MSLVHGWLKFVMPHSFDGLFVESHAEMANDAEVFRVSLWIDDNLDRDDALILRPARRICKLRLRCMDDLWCRDSPTHGHNAAPIATSVARPNANTMIRSHTSTYTLAKAGTLAAPLRDQRDLR